MAESELRNLIIFRSILGASEGLLLWALIRRVPRWRAWRNAWPNVTPFFQFPPEIRKITYTTNAIESLNATMRKHTRNRRIFPNDESALRSMFRAVREASNQWRSVHN